MKNTIKRFGIIALVTIIGFSMAGCDNGTTSVPVIAVTGVTLDKSALSLNVGDTETLTATVAPDNAANKAVTWTTSDETKASVENGVVTAVAAGTATITVTTTDGEKTDTCSVTITAVSVGTAPTITTSTLPDGTRGTAYNRTVTATGDAPITWSVDSGALPTGLSLAPTTGVISGTPTTTGTSTFTVKAANAIGSGTKQLSITISSPYTGPTTTAPTITTASLPNGIAGTAYSQTVTATGTTPFSWSVTGGTLPTGLTLSAAGVISGTPATAGTSTFTVRASNSAGSNTKQLSITIATAGVTPDLPGTITISPSTGVTTGTQLTATYSGSETVSYQWKKDGSNVGTNSNKYTPTAGGNYTVTVSAAGYNSKTSDAVNVNDPSLLTLDGTVTISPNTGVTTYTELTAAYEGSESATLNYQWKNGTSNVGTNSDKYTPTTAGNYTVTVSATGYNSKTSAAVTVALSDLSGTIAISPNSDVATYTELTATYSGSESVSLSYQWKKGSYNIGTNSGNFTPITAGSYTVTISAEGYNLKTSDAVTVALSDLSGTIAISPNSDVATYTELTATYSGSESATLNYQWKNETRNFGTNSNKFTPTMGGSYTVTISAEGYNPKTSNAVTVAGWTEVSDSPFVGKSFFAIAYGNNKFVAGGYGYMAYSTDGITWSAVPQSVFGTFDSISAIIYENNTFVAVSGSGSYTGGKIAYSTDGITWTAVSDSTFGIDNINAIAYGDGTFVAVGDNNKMAKSTDNGITWTAITQNVFSANNQLSSIAYGNNMFVAGSGTSGRMAKSTDNGTTWTAITQSVFTSNYPIYAITYANNTFVATGYMRSGTSTDGTTWSRITDTKIDLCAFVSIDYYKGKFVLNGGGDMFTSTNGRAWSKENGITLFIGFLGIAYGNNTSVAVGDGGIAYLLDN